MMVYVSGTEADPNELKPGDKFRVIFPEDEYVRTTAYGGVETRSGRLYSNMYGTDYVFVLTKKASVLPEHFPPQEGDVWRVGSTEYHVFKDQVHIGSHPYSSRASFADKIRTGQYKGILVHRKGNIKG